ncbi:MAG: LptE family protein [Bacteroidales bacterium]
MTSICRAFILVLGIAVVSACSVRYSFRVVSLGNGEENISVEFFDNRAKLINPSLSQDFTNALQDKMVKQSPLKLVGENGDLELSGYISSYTIRSVAITANDDTADKNRMTVTVKVNYINNKADDQSFERDFSAYEEYSTEMGLSQAESSVLPLIIDKLVEDIYNATLGNW